MARKRNLYTREQLLKAIQGSGGSVLEVSKRLGCAWSTARHYIDLWDETRKAFEDERAVLVDAAEYVVYRAVVEQGDVHIAKWVLSTLGRDRGWGDDAPRQGSVRVVVKWADDEEEQ